MPLKNHLLLINVGADVVSYTNDIIEGHYVKT